MTKIGITRLLLAFLCVFILAGASIFVYVLTEIDNEKVIEVVLTENESVSTTFDELSLFPGESCEYTVKLSDGGLEIVDITMDFNAIDDCLMKDFVFVKIESDGECVYEALLSDCLSSDPITVDYEKIGKEFKIIYSMPESVGNEAQNTEAHFELLITPII